MTGELNMDHSCFDSKMKRPNGMVADLVRYNTVLWDVCDGAV